VPLSTLAVGAEGFFPTVGGQIQVRPDGSILVAGQEAIKATVARLSADGTLDTSFGTGGIAQGGSSFPGIEGFAVDSHGRILLGESLPGRRGIPPTNEVSRLTPSGAVDSTFASTGAVGSPSNLSIQAIAVGPDDKVLIAATDFSKKDAVVDVARFTADGVPDPSFGVGGVAVVDYGPGSAATGSSQNAAVTSLVALPDGRVLLGGIVSFTAPGEPGSSLVVTRLTGSGALDTSFNGLGFVAVPGYATGMVAAEPDGSVFAAGGLVPPPNAQAQPVLSVSHVLANGTLDQAFGSAGSQSVPLPTVPPSQLPSVGNAVAQVENLDLQPNGTVTLLTQLPGLAVVHRLNLDGRPDPSFASDGFATLSSADAAGLAVQPDGNFLVLAFPQSGDQSQGQIQRYLGTANSGGGGSGGGGGGNSSPNLAFVDAAFRTLFHRDFDSSRPLDAGLLNGLNTGVYQPIDVTALLELSPEGQMVNTTDLFQTLLLRSPSASDLAFYQTFLAQGVSIQQLKGIILSSDEFFNLVGGTNTAWLDAVYQDVLGRQAGASDQSFWGAQLAGLMQAGYTAQGARQVVATAIVLSPEAAVTEARFLYTRLLSRLADPGGLAFVSGELVGQPPVNGGFVSTPVLPQQNVMAMLVASPEFIARS
jgi:uncharacterized delta-60 repeat protein